MVFSIFQKWREERRTKAVSTSGKGSFPNDDAMAWLFPPGDVHDRTGWDRYWKDQASHGFTPPLFDMFCHDGPLIQFLNQRGAKTVLCAGNGISQEPRALAAAGFDVIAMDQSSLAIHLAQTWQFSVKELDRFCPEGLLKTGGDVIFTVGDILDPSACAGPFDVIIERRTLQLFPEEERGAALDALVSRLQPRGLFLSHCHDGRWRPPAPRVHQVESFLRERGWPIIRGRLPDQGDGRIALLEMSTG